jgi:type IV pilus assembly protein PilM
MSSLLTKQISLPRLRGPELSLPSFGRKKADRGPVVGLEIEAGSIAAVEATGGANPQVLAGGIGALPVEAFRDGEVAEPEAVADALRALFAAHGLGRRVRLGLANQRLVVRTLRLPMIESPEELDAAVRFSAQEQIAMPLEEAVIEHRVVGGVQATGEAPAQIDVMVVAARREMILATLRPLRDAGLEPVGVDLSAFGMIRALAGDAEEPAPAEGGADPTDRAAVLYCNVGDTTNLAVARGRSCLFTRVSPVGLADIAGNLASGTGLSPEHANLWLGHVGLGRPTEEIDGDPVVVARTREVLERGAVSLVDELRLSLDFYAAQEGAAPVERIVLCGPGSAIPGLAAQMERTVGLPIATGRPAALAGYDTATAARLTLPLGLALDL